MNRLAERDKVRGRGGMRSSAAPRPGELASTPPAVALDGICRRFGKLAAVDNVSLEIPAGRFVSILGPSGCGKSTLLRVIAGLDRPNEGRVVLSGQDVTRLPPNRRPVNMIFQRYALFPNMTVGENIGFALTLKKVPKPQVRQRVENLLEMVRLPGFSERRVEQLSGGQAQRVALARALIDDPPVLLLDEPLTALDLKLRQAMRLELRQIHERVGATFLFVTHDQEEAMAMSDEIVIMNGGRIEQVGDPESLYRHPRTLFSAQFLGEANLLRARRMGPGSACRYVAGPVTFELASPPPGNPDEAWICLRPEQVVLANAGGAKQGANTTFGRVRQRVFQGAFRRYVVDVDGTEFHVLSSRQEGGSAFGEGDAVCLTWSTGAPVVLAD